MDYFKTAILPRFHSCVFLSLLLLLFITPSGFVFAQNATIKGIITDSKSNEPIPGVNIITPKQTGTTSDFNGKYTLEVPAGNQVIKFSYIGYDNLSKTVDLKAGETFTLNIRLVLTHVELGTVVVTGSQFEKSISQETVSMDVIKPELIKNTNATELSEVVYKTPGVQVQDGQVSIRGGSSFAYGVGSRVSVLLDDQPVVSGDLGDAKWKFIPIENAHQVEIVKGASSVIYGSAALNGVINVLTGWAEDKPKTEVSYFIGNFDNPGRKSLIWWDNKKPRYFTGGYMAHRQRFGNLDVVASVNINKVNSFLQFADEFRGRASVKTRYKNQKVEGLSYGINCNVMWENSGRFFLPVHVDTAAYLRSSGSDDRYIMTMIDPHLTYINKKNNRHSVKTRYFNVYRFGNGDDPDANSNLVWGEYQYQTKIGKEIIITSGLMGSYGFNKSNIFEQTRISRAGAVFSQWEYTPTKKLSTVAGFRYEINSVDTVFETNIPVFRTGVNYEVAKFTNLRASWGQAYRFPSIAERFVDASFAGTLSIIPNPFLKPERGWSGEVGVKQGLKIKKWMGYLDFTAFWSEYRNFVEYGVGLFPGYPVEFEPNGDTLMRLGFKPRNMERTRVAGIEFSIAGTGNLGPVKLSTFAGYSYNYPGDLNSDTSQRNVGQFIKNAVKYFGGSDSLAREGIMFLRNRHMVRLDVELGYKKFSVGQSAYYNSFPERIDPLFFLIMPGLDVFARRRQGGDFVMDSRIAYNPNDHLRIAFMIKNVTNLEYANRPGVMNPPRNFTLQVRYTF